MKKNQLKNLTFLAVGLGIVATVLLFFGAFKVGDDTIYSGFELAFGKKETFDLIIIKGEGRLEFNLLLTLALVFPVGAAVVSILLDNKLGSLIGIVLFVGSALLLFVTKETKITGEVLGISKTFDQNIKIQLMGIISAVLSILGGLTLGAKLFKELK